MKGEVRVITIEVNGKKINAKEGNTILSVLRENNIKVPSLCYMEELTPTGACRLCVVEVENMRNLVPSCSTLITDGMKILTHSPRVMRARKTIVELLLDNHPDDCLYCVRNANCELRKLAEELNIRDRNYKKHTRRFKKDISSTSICRDPEKCILCGRCVRVCEEIQSVCAIDFINRGSNALVGTAFNEGLNVSTCINCGQCIMVCPTGALTEQSSIEQIEAALNDPEMYVVVQHAPSISVSLGEEFGLPVGFDVAGSLNAALRELGFKKVFDTSFSADLTIMEEASELVERIKSGGTLPMFTSCSPGWIKFVEHNYPEFIPNLSSCKSPQQMMGAIIKTHFAQKEGIAPEKIFSVSIMPCTAKKFECQRPEMGRDGIADIDAVLTTRELVSLIKKRGIILDRLEKEDADTPFGFRSTAGKIFGTTGGVMEAALRTAYYLITGKELESLDFKDVRGLKGIKEAEIKIGEIQVGVAVVSGLANAQKLLEQIKNGRKDLHFIEVMTCPGGCIGGGGQLIGTDKGRIKARMKRLYEIDSKEKIRTSYNNPYIKKIYEDFLGRPLGEKSHHLLHTHYHKR